MLVRLSFWPYSETCIDCKHGRLVHMEEPATYVCLKSYGPDENGNCMHHEDKEGEEPE